MIELVNVKDVNPANYDNVLACVRSMRSNPKGLTQVPELSPSPELFGRYLELKKQGNWNEKAFRDIYVPRFLQDMKCEAALKKLAEVWDMDRRGMRIAIGCFCDEETDMQGTFLIPFSFSILFVNEEKFPCFILQQFCQISICPIASVLVFKAFLLIYEAKKFQLFLKSFAFPTVS